MRKFVIAGISLYLLLLIVLLVYININGEEAEAINIKQASASTQKDMETVINQEEELYKWADEDKIGDGGHIHSHNDEIAQKYNSIEGAITFLFSAVSLRNNDLFIQAFEPESLSKDLFQGDSVENNEMVERYIDDILKEQELTSVKYEQSKGVLNSKKDEAVVTLHYSDNTKASITLKFKHYSSNNHGDDIATYLVSTSPSEIVKQINTTN